jgi:hypothetical protein
MAILLGAVTLSGSSSLVPSGHAESPYSVKISCSAVISKVTTILTEAGISGRAIDQAAISSETSSYVVLTGVDSHMAVSGKATPSASGTLTTDSEIVRYVLGASDFTSTATTVGGSPSLGLAGKTYGHDGLGAYLTLAPKASLTAVLKAAMTAQANFFTSVDVSNVFNCSATLAANGTLIIYKLGHTAISAAVTTAGFARVRKTGVISMLGRVSLATGSIILTGLNKNNISLFMEGGHTGSTDLFMQGPVFKAFTSAITEGPEPDLGDTSDRPGPPLFIKGKGLPFNNNTTLFITTPTFIDDANYSMNLFIEGGLDVSYLNNSLNLFIANNWTFVQTSVSAPGFRNSEFPLFLKISEANTNTNMNLFIGKPANPTNDLTLFLQAQTDSISGVPPLYVSGQGGPINNIDLFMRGPADSTNNNIDLSINGY